jgi:hypothetical protein
MSARARLLTLALTLAVVSELLGAVGVGTPVHAILVAYVQRGDGFLSACFLAGALIAMTTAGARWRLILALGAVGELTLLAVRRDIVNLGAPLGIAALGVTAWEAIRGRRDETLASVALFPALLLAALLPLELTVILHPTSLDGRALLLDRTLFGLEPAWVIGAFFAHHPIVKLGEGILYVELPVAAAILFILERRQRSAADLQVAFIAAGVIGILFLHLAPIAGPSAFRPYFPLNLPPFEAATSELFVAGRRYRNSVPSMHTTWALLMYWHSRPLGWRSRVFAGGWLVLTIVAMLGLGEHYLVDVAISIPFAVLLRAVLLRSAEQRDRLVALAVGGVFYTLWLVLLRAPIALLADPWLVRPLALVGVGASLFVESRLTTRAAPPLPAWTFDRAWLEAIASGFGVGILPPLVVATTVRTRLVAYVLVAGVLYARVRIRPAHLAGAALGVLVSAYAFLPSFGTFVTVLIAVPFLGLAALKRESLEPALFERDAFLGCIALGGLELVYHHVLALVTGNSVFAHAGVLAATLLGAAAGARLPQRPAWGWLALVVLGSIVAWPFAPAYFADFRDASQVEGVRTFPASEVVRFVTSALFVVPPAFCAGLALRGRSPLNAAAALAGAVGAAALLPLVGSLRVIELCVVPALVARRNIAFAVAAVLLAVALPGQFELEKLAAGANVYFAPHGYGAPEAHYEDADVWLTRNGKTLLVDGKYDGAGQAFVSPAIEHTTARDHAVILGLGTGANAHAALRAGFTNVTVVDRAGAARVATDLTGFELVSSMPPAPFDLIGLETSTAWFDGAGWDFSRQRYTNLATKLSPHGVFQQWIQLHRVDKVDLASIFGTVRTVFPRVWLYVIERQGILVACVDCADATVTADLVLDPAAIDRLIAEVPAPITTNDNRFLELDAAQMNMRSYEQSWKENEAFLASFRR